MGCFALPRRAELRLRTAASLLLLAGPIGVVALAGGGTGCEASLEQPCKVTRREVLVADPEIVGFALTRSRGKLVATWERRELIDAGGKLGRDLSSYEVATIDESGRLGARGVVPAPVLFRSRSASVESAGVTTEEGAHLFYWVDTVKSTEKNGLVRNASALRAAYVTPIGKVVTPEQTECEQCLLTVVFAAFPEESIALVRIDPDLSDASRDLPPPRFVALRFRRDGSVEEVPTPWLELPALPGEDGGVSGLAPTALARGALLAEVDGNDRLNVTAGGRSWVAVRGLELLNGPIALPGSDAHVRWSANATEASVAWTTTPFEEGRTTDPISRREVFVGLAPRGTSGVTVRERATRGRAVLAFDRRFDELGTLFESAGRLLFTATNARGQRRGGDVLVEPSATGGGSEYGTPQIGARYEVIARGDGLFHVGAIGPGALTVTEIRCEP